MKDGRSDPGHRKKRPPRAAGGQLQRGSRDSRGRAEPEPGFGPFRGAQREDRRHGEEARAVRSMAEEAVARATGEQRPALRIVHGLDGAGAKKPKREPAKGKGARRAAPGGAAPAAAKKPRPVRDVNRLQEALIRGTRALDRGYEREALRILRPHRESHPDSADLRELLGVTYYRLGRWALAQKELEAFIALTDSTDQHPVLMDCARALGRFKKVDSLWDELRSVSPGAAIVTEGRIVAAGALADQGRIGEAIKILERAPATPKRVLPHHLRLWYALADLQERAGDIPAARTLFRKVSAEDPAFVDVAERLAALS